MNRFNTEGHNHVDLRGGVMGARIGVPVNLSVGGTGATMAVKPELVNQLFYDTVCWEGSIAILGAVVLVLTIVYLFYAIRTERRKNK